MVFSSTLFLFWFLPVVLIGYYLCGKNAKNYWLLLASLFFYSWGEPKYVLLMFTLIVINYICGLLLARDHTACRKAACQGNLQAGRKNRKR